MMSSEKKMAGVTSRAASANSLCRFAPGGDEYSWEELPDAIEALQDGDDIDYTGASGPIDMNIDGDATAGVFDLEERFPGPKSGYPNEPTINTATFSEVDGRTTLTLLVEAPRKEIRDAVVPSGMEDGLQDALDLLEEVAVSLDR